MNEPWEPNGGPPPGADLEKDLHAVYKSPQAAPRFVSALEQRLHAQAAKANVRRHSRWGRWLNDYAPVFAGGALALFALGLLGALLYAWQAPALLSETQPAALLATAPAAAAPTSALALPNEQPAQEEPPFDAGAPAGGASFSEALDTPQIPAGGGAAGAAPTATATLPPPRPTQNRQAPPETESAAEPIQPPPAPGAPTVEEPALAFDLGAALQPLVYAGDGSGLRVELYPLPGVSLLEGDTALLSEAPAPVAALENRRVWRTATTEAELTDSAVADPLLYAGYRLEKNTLYLRGVPLLTDVRWPDPSVVTARPWVAPGGQTAGLVVQDVSAPDAYYWVLGERVLRLDISPTGELAVRDGDTVLFYRQVTPDPDGGVSALWAWDGSWVLEYSETDAHGGRQAHVILDGMELAQTLQVDEVFGWRLIAGEPFYFTRTGDAIQIDYAGQTAALQFEDVGGYTCCAVSDFELQSNAQMAWFYARQGEVWHYVEAGVFPPLAGALP